MLSLIFWPADNDAEPQSWQSSIDIEKLEDEYALTLAEYMLSLVNVKWAFSGKSTLEVSTKRMTASRMTDDIKFKCTVFQFDMILNLCPFFSF